MMDKRDIIKRDLRILSLERKENLDSVAFSEKKSNEVQSIREKIKKFPVLGKLAWYCYSLLKAPFRIKELYQEKQRLYEELNLTKIMINEMRESLEFLKNDFFL